VLSPAAADGSVWIERPLARSGGSFRVKAETPKPSLRLAGDLKGVTRVFSGFFALLERGAEGRRLLRHHLICGSPN
jgi:hypothetical protein